MLRKNGLLIFHYEKSFPNPFHKKVNIKIVLGREEAVVALMIYDVGGRLVKSFLLLSPGMERIILITDVLTVSTLFIW